MFVKEKESREFNDSVYAAIEFDRKRIISDEDFDRLDGDDSNDCINARQFIDNNYMNYEEKALLRKFLSYKTFKRIKLHSLSITGYNRPISFQCLMHDNSLVLIDAVPKSIIDTPYGQKRMETLKKYCISYGFGYLTTDGTLPLSAPDGENGNS